MDPELRERVEEAAEEHALFNALKHNDDANLGAIMGPLMGENPEFRPHGDDIPQIVAPVIDRVNRLSARERRERLEALAPEALAEIDADPAEDESPPLPELPGVSDSDEVRLRCAPNPNGPWHIGSARMGAVIGTYTEMYDGWMVVRFDDTDPETKPPDLDAYAGIIRDLEYLGFEPDEVIKASDRLDRYYDTARELIEIGGAYTCTCPAEEFRELKAAGTACPHRSKDAETSRDEFDRMVAGEFKPGKIVLRIKTDIEHDNPALRDWVAFRIIDTPHPRPEAADQRCWPLLDYQSGIDDHDTEITHIVRGIDLQDSAKRQQFVYDYFDWEYPEVLHWGHVQVAEYDVKMSTSRIRALIEAGDLDGWDDPRAPTLRSLRRRGIRGEAVTSALVELGTSTSNVDLSMSSVYARNRELIDEIADRYFFVHDPESFPLVGESSNVARPPKHPNDPDRGTREIPVGESVYIEASDIPTHGERTWLKGLGCVRMLRDAFELTGEGIEVVREGDVPVIHWVPRETAVPVTVRTMDGTVSGHAEPGVASLAEDEMIQFERYGFARVDEQSGERTVVYFAHE